MGFVLDGLDAEAYDRTYSDRVLVRRDVLPQTRHSRPPQEPTGKVIRILERSRTQLVGTLQRGQQFLYVVPDDPRIPHDIYVPPAKDVGRVPNLVLVLKSKLGQTLPGIFEPRRPGGPGGYRRSQ